MNIDTTQTVGLYFISKWQNRLLETTYYQVSKQMRKQGIPLDIALLILFGCKSKFINQ